MYGATEQHCWPLDAESESEQARQDETFGELFMRRMAAKRHRTDATRVPAKLAKAKRRVT